MLHFETGMNKSKGHWFGAFLLTAIWVWLYCYQSNKLCFLEFPNHVGAQTQFDCHIPWWHFQGLSRKAPKRLTLPSLTPRCAELFLCGLGLAVHTCLSVWQHTLPYFLMLILTHGESFSWTMCLGVGRVDVGGLWLPLLVLCQVQYFPAPALT